MSRFLNKTESNVPFTRVFDMTSLLEHQPVLLKPVLAALNILPEGIYIDGTFGRGGHSRAILSQLGQQGQLWVCDRDPAAIECARKLCKSDPRVHVHHGCLSALAQFADHHQLTGRVNGILMDLGVSSPQLDVAERGFSFRHDGPLDMRMDPQQGESVAQWLNSVDQAVLAKILWQYGEEKRARAIASRIVLARQKAPINTTQQLAQIVTEVIPYQRGKHPATRTFQALRIYINDELAEVKTALQAAQQILTLGGRLAVITFHSLEDRIVKQFMREHVTPPPLPRRLPIVDAKLSQKMPFSWVVKQGKASEQEITLNPRARSAILRAIMKRT